MKQQSFRDSIISFCKIDSFVKNLASHNATKIHRKIIFIFQSVFLRVSVPSCEILNFYTFIIIGLLVFSPITSYAAAAACDIQKGPCAAKTADGMDVQFDIQPKPVTAMSELSFVVNLNRNKMPVPDASVVIDLSMPGMYMGKNTPVLNHVSNGRYEGKGVLTRCMSGRKTWQADVRLARDGKNEVVSFVFEVQ